MPNNDENNFFQYRNPEDGAALVTWLKERDYNAATRPCIDKHGKSFIGLKKYASRSKAPDRAGIVWFSRDQDIDGARQIIKDNQREI